MHTIRKGEPRDIAAIAVIYDRILDREERGGASTGWIRGVYPTRKTAEAALERGDLFVMADGGNVVAAAVINQTQVPEYKDAAWKHAAEDNEVMVLHCLVVDPLEGGKGRYGVFEKHPDYWSAAMDKLQEVLHADQTIR